MDTDHKPHLTVTKIAPHLWQINEIGGGQDVDAYLIEGETRAALVDALMSVTAPSLFNVVRSLTDKPIDVLITHIHPDHAGAPVADFAAAGCNIYASSDDIPLIAEFGMELDTSVFTPLADGQTFDLGGTVLETITLAGHTHGSALFVDKANRRIFSGDTIGSNGIWMQLPHSTALTVFADNMRMLQQQVAQHESYLIYPGHRSQSADQLTGIYISHMSQLADMVVAGEMCGDPLPLYPPFYDENSRNARFGMVGGGEFGLIYNIKRIHE